MNTQKIIIELEKIKQEIEKPYLAACKEADWHNNNMPNVGITEDYLPYPAKPQALETIGKLIENLNNIRNDNHNQKN